MKKLVLLISVLMFCNFSYATSIKAKIIKVRVDRSGAGMMVFDQELEGESPSCINTYYRNALAFDTNTAGGKSILATALAAKAQGVTVYANGLGLCTTYSGNHVEDVAYMVSE